MWLAADLAKKKVRHSRWRSVPNIDIADRRGQARYLRIVQSKWQDVFSLFHDCARQSMLSFKLRPCFAYVIVGDEHRTIVCFILVDFCKVYCQIFSEQVGLLKGIVEKRHAERT